MAYIHFFRKPLPEDLHKYNLKIAPEEMHHYLAKADLLSGESGFGSY